MSPPPPYDPTGIQYYSILSFKFSNGATVPIKVAYRVHPSTSTPSKGTILIPTCYRGHINTTLIFKYGRLAALKEYEVVVAAMLSNGESTSPSNTDDNFPRPLRYEDCVRSQYELLTKGLGVKELEAVIGFSMGGQQAYYWGVMYPSFVKNIIPVCSSAKTSPHNFAFLAGPMGALKNSVDYADGEYRAKGISPERGVRAFARAYAAWLTRGAWWREGHWKASGCETVEEYLVSVSEAGILGWDAEDLLCLADMWQHGDITGVSNGANGDFGRALEGIEARVLLLPCRTDQYFAWEDSENEVKHLKRGSLAIIESVWGHAAGGGMNLVDAEWVDVTIAKFLAGGEK
jgi:homoserine O-acetyltransferase